MIMIQFCQMCNGTQVMGLEPGNYIAPCIACASHRNLNDILKQHESAEKLEQINKERALIREHNDKVKGIF